MASSGLQQLGCTASPCERRPAARHRAPREILRQDSKHLVTNDSEHLEAEGVLQAYITCRNPLSPLQPPPSRSLNWGTTAILQRRTVASRVNLDRQTRIYTRHSFLATTPGCQEGAPCSSLLTASLPRPARPPWPTPKTTPSPSTLPIDPTWLLQRHYCTHPSPVRGHSRRAKFHG